MPACTGYASMHRLCQHAPAMPACTGYASMHRLCQHAPAMPACTGYASMHRLCQHAPVQNLCNSPDMAYIHDAVCKPQAALEVLNLLGVAWGRMHACPTKANQRLHGRFTDSFRFTCGVGRGWGRDRDGVITVSGRTTQDFLYFCTHLYTSTHIAHWTSTMLSFFTFCQFVVSSTHATLEFKHTTILITRRPAFAIIYYLLRF